MRLVTKIVASAAKRLETSDASTGDTYERGLNMQIKSLQSSIELTEDQLTLVRSRIHLTEDPAAIESLDKRREGLERKLGRLQGQKKRLREQLKHHKESNK